jgi:bifunctional UDP-N-acetylglucosamine pyrophosphorylase/glucosamine-1-phosphate N-acetyltransferase
MTLSIIILAAGQGKRMRSQLPKALHPLAGRPLLAHVIQAAIALNPSQKPIVVFAHQAEQVRQALAHLEAQGVEQKEPLGTGHAVLQAMPLIPNNHRVLVLYGDVPAISPDTLKQLIDTTPVSALGIITAIFPNPAGLGRIIRNDKNQIIRIIEDKDASDAERAISEINSGICLIPADFLQKKLPSLSNNNAQKEYYLTDIITQAAKENIAICSIHPEHYEEVCGVNDRTQLASLETFYRKRATEQLMKKGVTLIDPARFDLRGELTTGVDVTIDINVIIEGKVSIGNNCIIGPHCVLRDTIIADHVEIRANTLIEGADIAEHCVIGPFARIRAGTELSANVHIGNFVEIKKSWVDTGTKISHLSYIGDSEIGKQVNVGAGTITCNYDGVNKHKTIIGNFAFIGSNTELVAPVTIGEGATIGAGSTITRDTPANQLTLCRAQQRTIENWQRPKKKEKES